MQQFSSVRLVSIHWSDPLALCKASFNQVRLGVATIVIWNAFAFFSNILSLYLCLLLSHLQPWGSQTVYYVPQGVLSRAIVTQLTAVVLVHRLHVNLMCWFGTLLPILFALIKAILGSSEVMENNDILTFTLPSPMTVASGGRASCHWWVWEPWQTATEKLRFL